MTIRLNRLYSALIALAIIVSSVVAAPGDDAQRFLDEYEKTFQELDYAASLAAWASDTRIVEGDDTNAKRLQAASEALSAFTGSVDVIETCKALLKHRAELTPLQVKQLEKVLYNAADSPQTVPDLVKERIAVSTQQSEKLWGYSYMLDGEEVTTNDIDRILREENDLAARLEAWEASKSIGPTLKSGLIDLQRLRNATVNALDYSDYFTYQVSDYGLAREEMMEMMRGLNAELRPLYRELHTYVRHLLAERYGQPVPDLIPAHWLPNRWGQDWNALVEVEGMDLDGALAEKSPEWVVKQAEKFYVSVGLDPVPVSLYEKSSMYPLPAGTPYKKNNHASAWHLDLAEDVRMLMSVESNSEWYETTHHEFGHIYYFLLYSNPDVPLLLRGGANRALHEAVGSLMGLAAMQPRFAAEVGLLSGDVKPDPIQSLLAEALNYVVFVPFATGLMAEWEHDLYAKNLPPDQWNARWWELKRKNQGIVPPNDRPDSEYCDPPTKTHINDDAAQYYDYALSYIQLFQLHAHIARELLDEDPHDTNYYGQRVVGDFLRELLSTGETVDWRMLLRETTGEDLSANAMLEYFAPLQEWLEEQNEGRVHTLPEL
jgi:peptidyl-dipeptidase A